MKTKLMTIIAMCIMVTATAFAQTSEKMHKIEKGETIESIAQKYGVTVEDIQKANPNAGGYFFAGMSIKIPEKITVTENVETTNIQPNPIIQKDNVSQSTVSIVSDTINNFAAISKNTEEIDWGWGYTSIGYWNYDDFENWGLAFGIINPDGWGFDFTGGRACLKRLEKGGSGNYNIEILPNYTFGLLKKNKTCLGFTVSAGPSVRKQDVWTGEVTAGGNMKTKVKWYIDGYAQIALNAKVGPVFLSAGYNLWFPQFKTSSKKRAEGFVIKAGFSFN
ncbi:MAG: LysM domain-containing protein [Bacteroidaceae bacterium]|nr:LysM domain-containing protein [Bacteroidaceae bacterium]